MKPVVGIVRPINQDGIPAYDSLCLAVEKTLVLTLSLMGKYAIFHEEGAFATTEVATIEEVCEKKNIDNVIFGSLRTEKDKIILELSVYVVGSTGDPVNRLGETRA